MIERVKVTNFKSIKEVEFACKRVNILIGEPNSGKSNFLESLSLFSLGFTGNLKPLVRHEKPVDLFFNQENQHPIQVQTNEYSYDFIYKEGETAPFVFALRDQKQGIPGASFNKNGSTHHCGDPHLPIRRYSFPENVSYVERLEPYLWPPYGDNLLTILFKNKDVRDLARDMTEKFGLKLIVKPNENRIELQKEKEGIGVSWGYSILSDTLQRIIFYYAAMETNKNATLLFEEPESHAFPYYTKFLGESIGHNDSNQYFIATHNPYLLFAIIEKTPIENLNVLITYFENEKTHIKPLKPSEIQKMYDYDSSIFFNLDEFLGK